MSRIQTTFAKIEAEKRKALVTFIMAGDPSLEGSAALLTQLPDAGADIIELGMPFTDPAADGVTIQKAGQRALAAGASLVQTLSMVKGFRENNDTTPIVLMGYANPLYAYGLENFSKDAADVGVDGLIVVDLPPEEDSELRQHAEQYGLDMIRLVTPTTNEERLSKIIDGACGFLYYVSITGVTGAAKADLNVLKPHIEMIKEHTRLPVAIGFGIKTPQDAKDMSQIGDAVVVGSAIVDKAQHIRPDNSGVDDVVDLVRGLSSALR